MNKPMGLYIREGVLMEEVLCLSLRGLIFEEALFLEDISLFTRFTVSGNS